MNFDFCYFFGFWISIILMVDRWSCC